MVSRSSRPAGHALGIAGIVAAAGGMLLWTWGTWADIVVDFGRELYVPWQLAQGQRLYADIAFFNGPLSQYFNSLVFRLFGTGFWVLVACNLAILAGLILLLHYVLRKVSTWWSATVACLFFIAMFAFAQYGNIGNYNYVCPYSHEITHGLLLSLGMLACLWQVEGGGLPIAALAGGLLGMVFLTKSELFLAAAVTAGVTLALVFWSGGLGRRRILRTCGAFLGGFLAPPLLALALLSGVMPARQAASGVLSCIPLAAYRELSALPFYRAVMGTDDVGANLALLLRWAGYYAALLVPAALLALYCPKPRKPYLAWAVFLAVAVFFGFCGKEIGWSNMARPLPLVMLILLATLWVECRRAGGDAQRRRGLIRCLSLTVLATVLLTKIVLNARIAHYGFVLAMPATLVLVVCLWNWIPAAITRLGGTGGVFRGAAMAAGLAVAVVHLQWQGRIIGQKTIAVQDNGSNVIWTDSRGIFINQILEEIRAHAKPGQTLAVFPEGVMVNYLARMPNPTQYISFMPPEMILFGEGRMVEALAARPPDFILVTTRNMAEYAYRQFALDYGLAIWDWIAGRYCRVVPTKEHSSFTKHGIPLLERAMPLSTQERPQR